MIADDVGWAFHSPLDKVRMASLTNQRIDQQTRTRMKCFFRTLSEKVKRRYAAVEAQRLGHGGITCVAKILGCSTKTISRGIRELDSLEDEDPAEGRVRRPGAGRKKTLHPVPSSNKT